MNQSPEVHAFINRILSLPEGPGISLDEALQPSLDDEAQLRKLFATDKTNARLADPFVGLVDVFDAPDAIRTTRARVVKDDQDLSSKHVMPLSDTSRRKEGDPSVIDGLDAFKKNWAIFTEGSLSQLTDWNNVIAAGGSVLACLAPMSDATKESKRSIRKYFHSEAYPTSDVDLFLWGMNAEQAEKKIIQIYEAVRDSVPWDVTCVRTKHTVSIHSQYPYRSVQIILRLYNSPAEILAGFDIDAPCCLYNGSRVLANPRAIVAMMRQANTVDMTRRSPSYEVRLAKYSRRDFEVFVPNLERDNIDPTIYERAIARIEGLARLLVLEKLADTNARYDFLESRRNLRGRPNPLHRYYRRKRKYKGDLKEETSIGGLEMNDYDVATLHIPYGPGWTARRIDKLIYQTDLGMNSTFNPKNKDRRLHRHPAFFGTMEECVEDCCEHCPEPIDKDERKLQEEEDNTYVRGRIAFIEEDPGRQSISGSFNPIDVGEWSAQVYIGETEKFFAAIAAHDRSTVSSMIKNKYDVNRRDHVGRTALHLAIITRATKIACDLIEAGTRITARLVDGRSALHLAAQYDQLIVIRKLFEKSASNKAAAEATGTETDEETGDTAPIVERATSDDDWTSEDDSLGVMAIDTDVQSGDESVDKDVGQDEDTEDDGDEDGDKDEDMDVDNDDEGDNDDDDEDSGRKGKTRGPDASPPDIRETQEFPEDVDDQPDVLDVNLPDWDLGFTPLAHAVLTGSVEGADELLKEGADATLVNTSRDNQALHPLSLTILRDNEDEAYEILRKLLSAGASTSTADDRLRTIFHRAVIADKIKLVSTILKYDPNANTVLNFPYLNWKALIFPITSVIDKRRYSMLATLLAHGAKLSLTEEHVNETIKSMQKELQTNFRYGKTKPFDGVFFPLETAISQYDDVAQLLLALDVDFNVGLYNSRGDNVDSLSRKTVLDWVQYGISFLEKRIASSQASVASSDNDITEVTGWKKFYTDLLREQRAKIKEWTLSETASGAQELHCQKTCHSYLVNIERLLKGRGAKTWNELYPESPCTPLPYDKQGGVASSTEVLAPYFLLSNSYYNDPVTESLVKRYDELYEACFTGDDKKIEQLCLPPPDDATDFTAPLNISIQIGSSRWDYTGHTPLFAAICGRQWETAKLVMAIAAAQYKPPENANKFSTKYVNIYDDEDSDNASEASYDSDATEAPQDNAKFFDIARRPSSVESDIHPKRMLDEARVSWYYQAQGTAMQKKYIRQTGNLLLKTIYDNDLEAYNKIFNLYASCPVHIPMEDPIIDTIVSEDRVEILDAYIRKTGKGIEIEVDHIDHGTAIATNDKNKMYLGLTVHGKKRADLAKRSDPNAISPTPTPYPMVWRAARIGAKLTIEYLAGDRPLAAYQHYMATGGDERAYQMRRINNLENVLPGWLGWTISNLGDSPLMSAILSRDFDLLKLMFSKKAKFMSTCLHELIRFWGYNAVLLAAHVGCKPEIIHFLLAKSVSPAVSDTIRGWNVYHLLCLNGHSDVIEDLLKKLPRDVNEALLLQQSKGRLNTPLHVAVKQGAKQSVAVIVQFSKAVLAMRDVDGSTPLHCAVHRGYAEIAATLLDHTSSDILHSENGVGETPLDIARLQHTLTVTRNFSNQHHAGVGSLAVSNVTWPACRVDITLLKPELQKLRQTIAQLIEDGALEKDGRLADELLRFADLLENTIAAEQTAEEANPPLTAAEEPLPKHRDFKDAKRTLEVVSAAVAKSPNMRQLVHLVDVQKSVQSDLSRFSRVEQAKGVPDDGLGDGLDPEDDEESKERQRSFILMSLSDCVRPDNY